MEISTEEQGLFYLIKISGVLTVKEITFLKNQILQVMSLGHINIVIDMEKIITTDSSGVGLLMNISKKLSALKGNLVILKPSNDLKDIFNIIGLSSMVKYVNTIDQAEMLF